MNKNFKKFKPIWLTFILFILTFYLFQVSILREYSFFSVNKKKSKTVLNLERIQIQPMDTHQKDISNKVVSDTSEITTDTKTDSSNIVFEDPLDPKDEDSDIDTSVHIFYYGWYGTPEYDNEYQHWNHKILPHWTSSVNNKYENIGEILDPTKGDIGANFYPEDGIYSCRNPEYIEKTMTTLKKIGVNVLVLSYWGHKGKDENGKEFDGLLRLYIKAAEKIGVKIAIHLEPYKKRSIDNIKEEIKLILDNFGDSPALYKIKTSHLKYKNEVVEEVPLIYVYDSYDISNWKELLTPGGKKTIRNTELDCAMISLYLGSQSKDLVVNGGFDGIYTYFASQGFTHGSTSRNWESLNNMAVSNNLLFIPSVGPGYDDRRIRPWNSQNMKSRESGEYYKRMFRDAINIHPEIISITSWNEWHEGTQIEPVAEKKMNNKKDFKYEDYYPNKPDFYLTLTDELVSEFLGKKSKV